jgi:hypothetical protein
MHSPERRQPLAHLRAAAAQQIDDATDDLSRILPLFSGEPGRLSRRADFDAFAAARAGVDHGVDTALQCRFEGLSHGHNRNAVRRPIEGGPSQGRRGHF